jgi:hypothetical protein
MVEVVTVTMVALLTSAVNTIAPLYSVNRLSLPPSMFPLLLLAALVGPIATYTTLSTLLVGVATLLVVAVALSTRGLRALNARPG